MPTPELIRTLGAALYGQRWQTQLGSELGINRRTVQRWLVAEDEPRPGVWRDLLQLLDERIAAQQRLRTLLLQRLSRLPGLF